MSTMTMPGLRGGLDETMEALERAAIVAKFDFTREDRGCVAVEVSKAQRRRALQLSAAALRRSGYRVCCDETSVYAFPVAGGRGVMLEFGQRSRRRVAPHFALVGPDGVGKSTVLRLIRERIASEAPFLETTFRQWRPGLVPSLASLAGKPEANEGEPSAFRPKRDPGNLQWLRLGYYGLDYLAGPRWKHREE